MSKSALTGEWCTMHAHTHLVLHVRVPQLNARVPRVLLGPRVKSGLHLAGRLHHFVHRVVLRRCQRLWTHTAQGDGAKRLNSQAGKSYGKLGYSKIYTLYIQTHVFSQTEHTHHQRSTGFPRFHEMAFSQHGRGPILSTPRWSDTSTLSILQRGETRLALFMCVTQRGG